MSTERERHPPGFEAPARTLARRYLVERSTMTTTCAMAPRGKACGRHAIATLHVYTPPIELGACQNHLAALVSEYIDRCGIITVSKAKR